MTTAQTTRDADVVRRFYGLFNQDAFRAKDFGALDDILSPEFTDHNLIPGQGPGVAGLKDTFASFYDAFPDFGIEVDDLVAADGGKVAVRLTFTGTHRGDFLGAPPTGRSFRIQGMNLIHLDDEGRPTDRWGMADWQDLMRQLGLAG